MALVTKVIRGLRDPFWPLYFVAWLLPLMMLALLIAGLLKDGISLTADPLTIVLGFLAGAISFCLTVFRQGLSRLRSSRSTFLHSRPLIVKVNSEDLAAVTNGMPYYVLYGLTDCVEEVVKKPTVVFPGAPSGSLKGGLVFCGKPAHFFDNDHRQLDAPSDMVYMAYVNRSLSLFDWD